VRAGARRLRPLVVLGSGSALPHEYDVEGDIGVGITIRAVGLYRQVPIAPGAIIARSSRTGVRIRRRHDERGVVDVGRSHGDLAALCTSLTVMRPPEPVPLTCERSTPSSSAVRSAAGVASTPLSGSSTCSATSSARRVAPPVSPAGELDGPGSGAAGFSLPPPGTWRTGSFMRRQRAIATATRKATAAHVTKRFIRVSPLFPRPVPGHSRLL
jgi:hypothetical protein